VGKFESMTDIAQYRYAFHFFLLSLIIAIIYSNTLVQEWHFDDYPNIVEDASIHWKNITFNSIWKTVTTDGFGQNSVSRPIPRLTFAINYYFTGLNTLSYHITNIVIHLITAFFVYLVFQKTLIILSSRKETNFAEYTCQDIALLGAVFWAIHPMQTQSVVYIVQRMASMAAMFYIIAMFCYIQGRLKSGRVKRVIFFGACFVFWILAVFSKENAVLLPLSVIIYEIIFFGITKKKVFYFVSSFMISFVIAISILVFTQGYNVRVIYEIYSILEDKIITSYVYRPFTMIERLLTEPRILVWYLFLIVCPISDFLSLESDIVVSTSLFNPISTFISLVFILMLLFLSVLYYKKLKILSYAILFFLVNHIVESTFIGLELYFEHRNYLPSIFLYLVIAYGLMNLYSYYQAKKRVVMNFLVIFFIVSILVSEGNATYLRNDIWQTEETLHQDNLDKAPNNIRPRISLSSYYLRNGKFDESLSQLRVAEGIVNSDTVRIQKNWIGLLYHNFGATYHRMSEFDKSKINLLKSLEYDQYSWETHTLLGILFFMDGDVDQSIKAYTNAVTINSSDPKLFNMLGKAIYSTGQFQIALEAFRKGLDLAQTQQQHSLVKLINFNITACYMAINDYENAKMTLVELEKYFDKNAPVPNFYFRDINESLKKFYIYDDNNYLLYKSILYRENNRSFLAELADSLISNDEDYCFFINNINQNKSVELIYPPIDDIEKDLSKLYYEKIGKLIETLEGRMTNSLNCPTAEDYEKED